MRTQNYNILYRNYCAMRMPQCKALFSFERIFCRVRRDFLCNKQMFVKRKPEGTFIAKNSRQSRRAYFSLPVYRNYCAMRTSQCKALFLLVRIFLLLLKSFAKILPKSKQWLDFLSGDFLLFIKYELVIVTNCCIFFVNDVNFFWKNFFIVLVRVY